MHRVRTGTLKNVDQRILVEIRVLVGIAAQQERFIGKIDILRFAILLGIYRDSGYAHFASGTHHTQGDFAAVCNQ